VAIWLSELVFTPKRQLAQHGRNEIGHNALFWGDSHVGQLYPLIQNMNASQNLSGKGIIFAVSGSCPPVERFKFGGGFHCDDFAHNAMLRALQDDIDTIFIGFATWFTVSGEQFDSLLQKGRCLSSLTKETYIRELIAGLTENIAALRVHARRL
jgi:hypothetical protein